jgi:cholera toxin transcriptional activator
MPDRSHAPRLFRFGAYELDAATGDLRKQGARMPRLQAQPLQVLLMLLEHPQQVVTRDELRQKLWLSDTFVDFDHGLNTAINKLRGALGDSASDARYIETLPRQGYRFIAPVTVVDAASTGREPGLADSIELEIENAIEAAPSSRTTLLSDPEDLPAAPPERVRILFALIQVMYLCFYLVSLAKLAAVGGVLVETARFAFPVLLITAVAGIPIRLYLLSAVLFHYRGVNRKFLKLFPFVFPLDVLWALAPLLIVREIGIGLALAAVAALLYVPFAERSLLLMKPPNPRAHD